MNLRHYNILFALLVLLFASCANRGIGPQGGPKDSIPPVPLHSDPEMGAVNFTGKQIEVTFDEYIELNNVMANLMMSPPQVTPPEVKARGKRLIVKFQDTLRENTTYTIDFGDAVCDFRERVPLHGFSFCFATGPEIDTLVYSGRVYDASNMDPVEGIIAGIHSSMADSAFERDPFLRVSKTDKDGYFHIRNLHEGTYRLYALEDISNDYRLTLSEALAFRVEPIEVKPEIVPIDTMPQDTLIADSLLTDSLHTDKARPKKPLTSLFLFSEKQQRLYLQRSLRPERHRIQFLFSASPDSLPQVRPLTDSLHYTVQYTAKGDTMTMWLLDSASIKQDSLFIETRYRETDSLNRLEWSLDTIRVIWREPKMTPKAKEEQDRKNRNRRLELKTNARQEFEIYDTLWISCSTPLQTIEQDSIHLYERIDTLLKPMSFSLLQRDSFPMKIAFLAKFEPSGHYELVVDSGAMHDIYGITHIRGTYNLKLKSLADYSTLRVKLKPSIAKMRIQLLSAKDEVLRELPAKEEGALFEHLKPDTYYLRCYEDQNEDGQWTTGSWEKKRQPEPIYYFPEKVQTKSNWDFEEEFDYTAVERTESKPKELINASPKKKKQ